ncbi:MAG: carboxypeptidase regulatory-like domain-containing protein, partial [Bdellovibrionales bacterium]|nr:carboxypeptidase regulatory-like domain-containing protein [Bdellovibrionales bacterium]
KGKQFLNRSLCIASYPRVDPNFKLQKQYMEITSIEPFYEDRGSPLFFNELVVEYNGDQEGNFTSAVTLRSILSINYYGETVSKRVEMPYVYTQENALKVGREYLEQAHVVPLKMSINYERALPGIQTMDTVEIVEWPGGIAEDGYFRNLICFVQRIVTDNTRNRVALEVVTRDYHHLPPLIETTYLNDTQGFGGSIAVASFSQSRSFTVTSNSAGNPPIAGAQVTIIQTGETKTTDASGQVVFDLLPGRYRLLIRGAGYRESSFEVIVA